MKNSKTSKTRGVWLERAGIGCLFLFLLTMAITITINFRPLYVFSVNHLDILSYTDLDKATLMDNFDQLMQFLNSPFNHELVLPDFPMSQSGLTHFYDVKVLFLINYGVCALTVVPSVLYFIRLRREGRLWRLIRPFQIGMGVPIVLGVLMAIGFERFFVLFHELLFSNDDWLFNPVTDPIINVLPETFFMYSFILFFILMELFFYGMVFIGKRQLKQLS